MGLISPAQVSDGTTADASDVNSPINTIANEFNGNIDNANIKTAAAIDGSKLASGSVTDTQMATAVKPVTRFTDDFFDHVASGCVWSGDSYGGSLAASMTAGVVYVSGVRLTVAAVTARAFTASKDTYVDVDSTGAVTYTEATTNAASSALAANSVRIAIIVSGATITAVGAVNQGQENKILPIASSVQYTVTDSLGNLICPRDPNRKVLGYKTSTSSFVTAAQAQVTGLSCPVIVPTGRKVRVSFSGGTVAFSGTAGRYTNCTIWEGAVGAGTNLQNCNVFSVSASSGATLSCFVMTTPSSSSKTYTIGMAGDSGATSTLQASSTAPIVLMVELV